MFSVISLTIKWCLLQILSAFASLFSIRFKRANTVTNDSNGLKCHNPDVLRTFSLKPHLKVERSLERSLDHFRFIDPIIVCVFFLIELDPF